MFTANTHLGLMEQARPGVDTWRGKLVPEERVMIALHPRVLNFLVSSPETTVRWAQVSEHGADHTAVDMVVEGESESAVDNFVTAAIGGLMAAGINPKELKILSMQLASEAALRDGSKYLSSIDYDVKHKARLTLEGLAAMYAGMNEGLSLPAQRSPMVSDQPRLEHL